MKHGSLFSGIGGFDLAAQWMGWENIFHCEINTFCQSVLKYYWPKSITYDDIKKTDFTVHRGEIDVLSGGFPCQPYSTAGKRLGKADERHLFPEMLRAITEMRPRYIIGENVRGLISWNDGMVFHEVYDDLEREGYEVLTFLIPAAGVNAPHRRDRVFYVAKDTKRDGLLFGEPEKNGAEVRKLGNSSTGDTDGIHQQEMAGSSTDGRAIKYFKGEFSEPNRWETFPTVRPICDGDDGLSSKLDGITFSKWRKESIMAGGNAVVPQVCLQLFKAIEEFESLTK